MARPKYSITSDDVIHATQYLRTRLLTLTVKFDESISPRAAQKEFEQAVDIRSKEDRANGVNAWCEKFLGELEWGKLKTSIRKRRENMGTLGWYARSQALQAKGDLAGAMEESKRALATLWTEDYALLLARQHLIKGDVPSALTLVTNCFKTVGASPESLGLLGSALAQSGQADEARGAWRQACDMGGDFHAEIAGSLEKSGLKDAAAVERGLALFVRGKSAFLRNDLSGALRDLEPAAKAAPASAIVWFYLAEARRFTGERDGARDAYARCLKLQPNHGRAFAALQKLPAR